jgi:hydrogenase maturation protease
MNKANLANEIEVGVSMVRPEPERAQRSALVLGLGNPILGDDGVGWAVASAVEEAVSNLELDVEVDFASLGGLSLMERTLGYEYVILIDSIDTGKNPVGRVQAFPLDALLDPAAGHSASAHDASLRTALGTAAAMGEAVPRRVDVVAIEATAVFEFTEELTPAMKASVPLATQKVLQLLEAHQKG